MQPATNSVKLQFRNVSQQVSAVFIQILSLILLYLWTVSYRGASAAGSCIVSQASNTFQGYIIYLKKKKSYQIGLETETLGEFKLNLTSESP